MQNVITYTYYGHSPLPMRTWYLAQEEVYIPFKYPLTNTIAGSQGV